MTGYLGLGSNQGDRIAMLRAARVSLERRGVAVTGSSSVYETAPQGEVLDQPDFLNAVVRIETDLAPEDLLDACKAVERELGQRLVFDVSFELDECDATVTDRVEDTIDYGEVCEQIALAAQERSYNTLERLCTAVADRLIDRFGAESVRVKAAKPEPPIPLPVDEVSVEVWKEA